MRKSRFSEEQIIGVLKEHQAGLPVAEICRRHGISDATFYTWRAKYGGLEVSDAKRLKALEEENRKLKKLLAEQMLDARRCARCSEKTSDAQLAEEGRDLGDRAEELLAAAGLRAGRARARRPTATGRVGLDDAGLRETAARACPERRRFGYRRLLILLRREGLTLNHKRLFRLVPRGAADRSGSAAAASERSARGRR